MKKYETESHNIYRLVGILIFLLLLLTACDSADDTQNDANNTPTGENSVVDDIVNVEELPNHDLEDGNYRLAFSGDINAGDAYTGTRNTIVKYDPFGSGTNSEGETIITMLWDGIFADEPTDITVGLVMRDGITAGTYDIGSRLNDEATNQVRAYISFDNFDAEDYRQDVTGSVTFESINRQFANGTFEFTATTESGLTATASGAFHAIPFQLQQEFDLTVAGSLSEVNVDNRPGTSVMLDEEADLIEISIIFNLTRLRAIIPADIAIGSYDVGEGQTIQIIWDNQFPMTGTFELTEIDNYLSGYIDLNVTTDEGDGSMTGTFEGLENPLVED